MADGDDMAISESMTFTAPAESRSVSNQQIFTVAIPPDAEVEGESPEGFSLECGRRSRTTISQEILIADMAYAP